MHKAAKALSHAGQENKQDLGYDIGQFNLFYGPIWQDDSLTTHKSYEQLCSEV